VLTDQLIRQALAQYEAWISRARVLLDPNADWSSVDDEIKRAERRVPRMRALLA
jgi:hypothetical protein